MSKTTFNEIKSQVTNQGKMPEIKQRAKMSIIDMELFQINNKNAKISGEGWLKTATIFFPPQACQSFHILRNL